MSYYNNEPEIIFYYYDCIKAYTSTFKYYNNKYMKYDIEKSIK